MSEENEFGEEGNSGSGGGLRKQLEEALAKLKTLESETVKYRERDRAETVRNALKAKQVPDAGLHIADLYTAEDVSDDAVGKWLEKYGSALGVQSNAGDGQQQEVDQNAVNAGRVNAASFGDSDAGTEQLQTGVMGNPEELMRLMNTLPDYDSLVKAGLMPKLPK